MLQFERRKFLMSRILFVLVTKYKTKMTKYDPLKKLNARIEALFVFGCFFGLAHVKERV